MIVTLLTPGSLGSSWVAYETGYAIARKKRLNALGFEITAKQAERTPYEVNQILLCNQSTLVVVLKQICLDHGVSPPADKAIEDAVRAFFESVQPALAVSVNRRLQDDLVHAAGIVGAHAPAMSFVPRSFVVAQTHLVIVLKDGWGFFRSKERLEQLRTRFKDSSKTTQILVVDPESRFLAAIQHMDVEKEKQNLQRKDCLSAVAAMRALRKEVEAQVGDIRQRVSFLGHDLIPTWTGFIGDDVAYVSPYFTEPKTMELNRLELRRLDEAGDPLPFYQRMFDDAAHVARYHSRDLFESSLRRRRAISAASAARGG